MPKAPFKIKIQKDDTVVVTTGADKGKKGRVLKVFPYDNKAIVEGVRIVKKHLKPQVDEDMPNGGIVDRESPIHISNLMLIDPKSGEPTKVGRKMVDGKLKRINKSTEELID